MHRGKVRSLPVIRPFPGSMTTGLSTILLLLSGLVGPMRSAVAAEPDQLDPAAAFLMHKYQITEAEALRRLELQDQVTTLLDDYDSRLGDGYGGLWIDQANGGVAVVGALPGQEQILRELAASRGVEPQVVRVSRSIERLHAIQARLEDEIPVDSGLQVGGIHTPTNQVEVLLAADTDAGGGPVRLDLASQILRDFAGEVRLRTVDGVPGLAACVVHGDPNPNVWCDSPLRGGVGISANLTFYEDLFGEGAPVRCSAGYNVRSRFDGLPYLLTAGHCRSANTGASGHHDERIFQTRLTNDDVRNIGHRHYSQFVGGGDAMILHINNESYWDPRPWVFVTGDGSTTRDETYSIERDGANALGMVVCMTGRRDGTECGEVISNDVPGVIVDHVAEVDGGCIRGGDSGGPVYRFNTAYGIVHGGRFPGGNSNLCSTSWFYQGIRDAMDLMNVRLVTTSNP